MIHIDDQPLHCWMNPSGIEQNLQNLIGFETGELGLVRGPEKKKFKVFHIKRKKNHGSSYWIQCRSQLLPAGFENPAAAKSVLT